MIKNMIVTGTPGIGKTTLIKECTYPFRDYLGGFFTEEIKENQTRKGFLLKTFSNESGVLAAKGLKSNNKLNKYGVDLKVLEEIGVRALKDAMENKKCVVVDEIGTMEMMSPLFCETIAAALGGNKYLLATIRLKAEPFTKQIKKMAETELLVLNRDNFPEIKSRIRSWLEEKCLP